MLENTVPMSIEAKANVFNFSTEEKNRREAAIKNKDFYYDRSRQYLELISTDIDPITINLTKPIIKKMSSLLYSRPLMREFSGPSKSVSFIEGFYKTYKIDTFLKKVDLLTELTGTAVVFVGIDEYNKLYLRIYDASDLSIIQNDDNQEEADAVSIVSLKIKLTGTQTDPQAERYLESQIWTNNYITRMENGIRSKQIQNELGFLPFVPFKGNEVYSQYLGHAPATGIVQLNSVVNQQLTNIGHMVKMQAGTPISITGFENGEGIQINPGRALSLPAGATADVLNFNPKILESIEFIKYLEEKIYETTIPKVTIAGDIKSQSGRELIIKWYPIIELFNDKTSRFTDYELNLANMILKVSDLEPLDEVKIDFPDEKLLPIDSEPELLEKEFRLGLNNPANVLQERNPLLSDDEAIVEVEKNLKISKIGGLDAGRSEER